MTKINREIRKEANKIANSKGSYAYGVDEYKEATVIKLSGSRSEIDSIRAAIEKSLEGGK